MSEHTVWLPVPFHTPARREAGTFFRRRNAPPPILARLPPPRMGIPDLVDGWSYDRAGRIVRDRCLGIWVDIYV